MNAVIYQLVCTRFFRPFIVKYIKKLQEKRFHFTKNLAYILPQNGLKVSNFKDFLLISRHQLTRKRNAIEGIPSVLRRRFYIDEIPVFGFLRSRQFFLFKIGAYNFNKLLRHNKRLRAKSVQNLVIA